MAVAFRAAGTLVNLASGTSCSVSYPAGVASGDLLIIQCAHSGGSNTITVPSGWNRLFGPVTIAGSSERAELLWRVAGASEPSSVTISASATSAWSVVMSAWTGCDTTTPIDVSATAALPTSGTTGTCPSVTTTQANTRLLHMYWGWTLTGGSNATPNAADTEHYDLYGNNQGYVNELASKLQAATGSTGTSAATFSVALGGGLAATIALVPAVTTPPVADFTGTPTSGLASLSVTFTDSSTNSPTSWAWDFGDGGTSSSQNPSHSYTTSGVYTVTLIATNAAGSNTKTRTGYITVTETVVYATGGGLDIY